MIKYFLLFLFLVQNSWGTKPTSGARIILEVPTKIKLNEPFQVKVLATPPSHNQNSYQFKLLSYPGLTSIDGNTQFKIDRLGYHLLWAEDSLGTLERLFFSVDQYENVSIGRMENKWTSTLAMGSFAQNPNIEGSFNLIKNKDEIIAQIKIKPKITLDQNFVWITFSYPKNALDLGSKIDSQYIEKKERAQSISFKVSTVEAQEIILDIPFKLKNQGWGIFSGSVQFSLNKNYATQYWYQLIYFDPWIFENLAFHLSYPKTDELPPMLKMVHH